MQVVHATMPSTHLDASRIARLVLLVLLLTVAAVFWPSTAAAQVLYGSLTGSVTDSSQAAIPGASVQALNTGTGVLKQTTTNPAGIYSFSDLLPGVYKVTISSGSFRTVGKW